VLFFTHCIFNQYRETAPYWCRVLIDNAIKQMLPARMVAHDGPLTMTAQVLEQPEEKRYTLHLLTYIPVRKSAKIDIIEDRTKVRDVSVTLRLPKAVTRARLVPEGTALDIGFDGDAATICIPEVDGYGIVELGY
jgi:hypothetical protein